MCGIEDKKSEVRGAGMKFSKTRKAGLVRGYIRTSTRERENRWRRVSGWQRLPTPGTTTAAVVRIDIVGGGVKFTES